MNHFLWFPSSFEKWVHHNADKHTFLIFYTWMLSQRDFLSQTACQNSTWPTGPSIVSEQQALVFHIYIFTSQLLRAFICKFWTYEWPTRAFKNKHTHTQRSHFSVYTVNRQHWPQKLKQLDWDHLLSVIQSGLRCHLGWRPQKCIITEGLNWGHGEINTHEMQK